MNFFSFQVFVVMLPRKNFKCHSEWYKLVLFCMYKPKKHVSSPCGGRKHVLWEGGQLEGLPLLFNVCKARCQLHLYLKMGRTGD